MVDLASLPAVTTADLALPVGADFYTRHGATPEQAASLAVQHNAMSGRNGPAARAAIAPSMENLPPPAKLTAAATMSSAQAAEALAAHEEAQFSQHLEATFAPPISAHDYRFPSVDNQTDEQFAQDAVLRTALHAERVPKYIADSIAQNLASVSRTLENATAEQIEAHVKDNKASLQRLWGKDFHANLATLDVMLDQVRSRSPELNRFIESSAALFSPLDMDSLLQLARHRAGNIR